ncbi:MAG: hypothetical protein HFF14_03315 [Angelakisella sp.]|nr:hypothetical protein [Angelakisella sp.]
MSSMTVTRTSPVQGVQKPQGGWSAQEQAAAQQAAISAQAGQGGGLEQEGQPLSLEEQAAQLQPVRQNDPAGLPQEDTPTLMERMIEAQKKAKEQRDKFRIPKNTRYGDRAIEAYARLSRARRQSDVSVAASYARRQIAQLKIAKRQDDENAPRIQAAINQLQKAVVRAGKKKRDLNREELTEARRRRAAEKDQTAEAYRLRQELRRRQKLRMIREHGYIREAEIDERHQQQMAATRAEFRSQLENLAGSTGDPAVKAQYAAQMAADGTAPAPTPPEISIEA